jgi:hypothetical protein
MNEYTLLSYLRGQLSDENITDGNIQRLAQQLTSLNDPTRDDLYKTCRGFLTPYIDEEQTINAVSTKTAKFIQRNTEEEK